MIYYPGLINIQTHRTADNWMTAYYGSVFFLGKSIMDKSKFSESIRKFCKMLASLRSTELRARANELRREFEFFSSYEEARLHAEADELDKEADKIEHEEQ